MSDVDKMEEDDVLFGSDDDDEPQSKPAAPPAEEDGDLFGDSDSDADDQKVGTAKSSEPKAVDDEEVLFGSDDENEDKENPVSDEHDDLFHILGEKHGEPTKPRAVSQLCINNSQDLSDSTAYFMRTPNFFKVQPAGYDSVSHRANLEPQERSTFAKATAVMRWRYRRDAAGDIVLGEDGNPIRESNARLIKWSDGSLQLVVGGEVFKLDSPALQNCYTFQQQRSAYHPDADLRMPNTKQETCLECVGSVTKKMLVTPTSLESETHARMTNSIHDNFKKGKSIYMRDYETITQNPEKELEIRAKEEEELLRRERKLRDLQANSDGSHYGTANGSAYRRPAMSAAYLTDNAFDESVNVMSMKKQFKKSIAQKRSGSSRDDDRQAPASAKKKSRRHDVDEVRSDEEVSDEEVPDEEDKAFIDSDDDEDLDSDEGSDVGSDEDEEEEETKKSSKKSSKSVAKSKDKDKKRKKEKKVEKAKPKRKAARAESEDDDDDDDEDEDEDSFRDDEEEEEASDNEEEEESMPLKRNSTASALMGEDEEVDRVAHEEEAAAGLKKKARTVIDSDDDE